MNKQDINNNDWSKAVSDLLRDAETPTSNELWKRVEASSGYVAKPNHFRIIKWTVATAAILILGLLLNGIWDKDETMTNHQNPVIISNVADTNFIDTLETETTVINIDNINSIIVAKNTSITHNTKSTNDSYNKIIKEDTIITPQQPKKQQKQQKQQRGANNAKKSDDKTPNTYRQHFNNTIHDIKKDKKTLLSVNFGGGTSKSNYLAIKNPYLIANSLLSNGNKTESSFSEMYELSDISHKQPFNVTLKVGHSFNNNFSIGSGLSYTLLLSKVTLYKENSSTTQKLQYLGLPLWINYDVFSYNDFSLYVGAGTQLEYCISAKVENKIIQENKWQTSVNTMIGAKYNINDWINIYCEPDLSYYFTSTKLKSIRNDHPLNFTVRFGIGFTL